MRVRVGAVFLAILLTASTVGAAQFGKRSTPPPLRVFIPFDAAWKGMVDVLETREIKVLREDRGQGVLTTAFQEYISGPLTESHMVKITERRRLSDGNWIRVLFQYEVEIDLIEARETVVTVYANVRALKRDFLGREEWVELPSSGTLEGDLLTAFGRNLFGQTFELENPRRGFWQREPGYVSDNPERMPRIAGPERHP